jgi:hypothetical protein
VNGCCKNIETIKVNRNERLETIVAKNTKDYEMEEYKVKRGYVELDRKKTIKELNIAPNTIVHVHGRLTRKYPIEAKDILSLEETKMAERTIFIKPLKRLVMSNIASFQVVSRSHCFKWEFCSDIVKISHKDVIVLVTSDDRRRLEGQIIVPKHAPNCLMFRTYEPMPPGKFAVMEFNEKYIHYADGDGYNHGLYYHLEVEKEDAVRLVVKDRNSPDKTNVVAFNKACLCPEAFVEFVAKAISSDYVLQDVRQTCGEMDIPIDRTLISLLKDMDCITYSVNSNDIIGDIVVSECLTLDQVLENKEKKAKEEGAYF